MSTPGQQQQTTCDCGGEMLGGICIACGWWPGRDHPPGELVDGILRSCCGEPMPSEQPFMVWIAEVQAEARQRLGRNDIEWLIGDARDMKPSFRDGRSPAEYVAEQVENID